MAEDMKIESDNLVITFVNLNTVPVEVFVDMVHTPEFSVRIVNQWGERNQDTPIPVYQPKKAD